jgi:hypothetical protein
MEFSYLLGTKISCCLIRAICTLLIEIEYILSEVVVHYLSITQCTLVWEWEPWSVSQVRPCDQTVLKTGLKWNAT